MYITIGTAQFGFKYGLDKIKINNKEILKIKKTISKNNIKYWDTAINYGRSEKILGNLKMKKKVITKITLTKKKVKNLRKWYENTLRKSLKRLKVKSLYGLLIHNTADIFFDNKKFLHLILESKKKKLVSKILDFLEYADGKNNIVGISKYIKQSLANTYAIYSLLVKNKLLKN
jgi:aryl-alcohol dehydrogenase-like predicted oxidoreductase